MTKKRSARITKAQIDLMISYIETEREMTDANWNQITEILNNSGQGPIKSVTDWKKAFKEIKTNTRRKAREVTSNRNKTGGGKSKVKRLSEREERVMSLISEEWSSEAPKVAVKLEPVQKFDFEEHQVAEIQETKIEMSVQEAATEMSIQETASESSTVSTKHKRKFKYGQIEKVINQQIESSNILAKSITELSKAIVLLSTSISSLAKRKH